MTIIETKHEFTNLSAAWEFVRDCDANGLHAGCPETARHPAPHITTVRVLRPASDGHIAVIDGGAREAFEWDGEVFIAPAVCPLDIKGRRQGARWECSRAHWDRYFNALFAARVYRAC